MLIIRYIILFYFDINSIQNSYYRSTTFIYTIFKYLYSLTIFNYSFQWAYPPWPSYLGIWDYLPILAHWSCSTKLLYWVITTYFLARVDSWLRWLAARVSLREYEWFDSIEIVWRIERNLLSMGQILVLGRFVVRRYDRVFTQSIWLTNLFHLLQTMQVHLAI